MEGLRGHPTNTSDTILLAMRCCGRIEGRGVHDQNAFLGLLRGAAAGQQGSVVCPPLRGRKAALGGGEWGVGAGVEEWGVEGGTAPSD